MKAKTRYLYWLGYFRPLPYYSYNKDADNPEKVRAQVWKKCFRWLFWGVNWDLNYTVCRYIYEHEPIWDGGGYHCYKCGLEFAPTGKTIGGEKEQN